MTVNLALAGVPNIQYQHPDDRYQAGACNIGPAEITRRWRFGHFAAIVGVILLTVLVLVDAAPLMRFVVALPAAVAAACYIEAYLKFCIRFGWLGLFNFGDYGTETHVADRAALARDRRHAFWLSVATAVIGVAVGVVAVLLPV